jgi:hypothetical protein
VIDDPKDNATCPNILSGNETVNVAVVFNDAGCFLIKAEPVYPVKFNGEFVIFSRLKVWEKSLPALITMLLTYTVIATFR